MITEVLRTYGAWLPGAARSQKSLVPEHAPITGQGRNRLPVEYGRFHERADRAVYVARRFVPYLRGKVLDVGCDRAVLKELMPELDYWGIDVSGTPDRIVDLEVENAIPFPDGSFDSVVCTDVLEHLDNLHRIFGELIRVSRRYVILSLPNNWTNARVPLARGRGQIGHYGLPADPPLDRHKWFFSLIEAEQFLNGQTAKHPFRIVELFAMERPRPMSVRWMRRLISRSQRDYLNRYAHTLWAVLERSAIANEPGR